jgi:hypothetical protein
LAKVFGFAPQFEGNEAESFESQASNADSTEEVISETRPVGKEQQEVAT